MDTIQRWRLKQRLRLATIDAAVTGVGAATQRWPIAWSERDLRTTAETWLRDQLAAIRTPYHIDTCGIMVKLIRIKDQRRTVLWSVQIPSFSRAAPHAALQELTQHLCALPLHDYPTATHIEVRLVSIGDIVAA